MKKLLCFLGLHSWIFSRTGECSDGKKWFYKCKNCEACMIADHDIYEKLKEIK
jgi:hypothetical protein